MSEPARLAAFSTVATGGNPAGVWRGETLPSPAEMQRVAADIGYSETAFLAALGGQRWRVRYYSPLAEVAFCGHATIASGVLLGDRVGEGTYVFETAVGDVPVEVGRVAGDLRATLTSVEPEHRPLASGDLERSLALLNWQADALEPTIPPVLAFAGAWHLVLAVAARETLAHLDYDFDGLKAFMLDRDLTTLQLIWRENATIFHARNPFPVGGVVEDPATGAAAAALGGYLRAAALIEPPASILIRQGEDMGRPSRISVEIPEHGGIRVSGSAVATGDDA